MTLEAPVMLPSNQQPRETGPKSNFLEVPLLHSPNPASHKVTDPTAFVPKQLP